MFCWFRAHFVDHIRWLIYSIYWSVCLYVWVVSESQHPNLQQRIEHFEMRASDKGVGMAETGKRLYKLKTINYPRFRPQSRIYLYIYIFVCVFLNLTHVKVKILKCVRRSIGWRLQITVHRLYNNVKLLIFALSIHYFLYGLWATFHAFYYTW